MRNLVAIMMTILIISILGTILTFLLYIGVLFLVTVAATWLANRLAGRRIRTVARSVDRKAAKLAADLAAEAAFEESIRDPAWKAAIDARRAARQRLVDQFIDLATRLRKMPRTQRHSLGDEFRGVEKLVFATFGQRVSAMQPDVRERLDPEPPRDEVIHLDRPFQRISDCRYGHWDEHAIEEFGNGLVVRRCAYCEPSTRWTEKA